MILSIELGALSETKEMNMACYVNPKRISKETWLFAHGVPVPEREDLSKLLMDGMSDGTRLVCLIVNTQFTAAMVVRHKQEIMDLRNDSRPRVWFLVERKDLLGVSDIEAYEGA